MQKSCKIATLTLLICLLLAGQAGASLGTVTANLTGEFTDGTILISGVRNVEGYGGIYLLNKTAGTGEGASLPNGLLKTYCIDLLQNSSSSSLDYDVVLPENAPIPYGTMGSTKAGQVSELWGRYYVETLADAQKAEAFSTAVWEIIFESDPNWDVTSGAGFSCTGLATGMDTLANSWLASLDGTGYKVELRALVSDTYQDYIIPEPATLAIFMLGGVAVFRRRK